MWRSSVLRSILCILPIGLLACGADAGGDSGDAPELASAESAVTQGNMAMLVAKNLVGRAEATRLAAAYATAKLGRVAPVVDSTDVQVDDRTGSASIYVVNFKGGGFVLVSADKRQTAILAYSDTDHFDVQGVASKQAPEGVRGFLLRAHEQTYDIRAGAIAPVSSAQAFDRLGAQLGVSSAQTGGGTPNIIVPGPDNCTGSYSHTYELNFPAQWDQGCDWNSSSPFINGGPCGHAWAGCVAVAVGQVMKYYAYPGSFDWGSMADVGATFGASQLLRDIGNRLDMDWGADGSGAHVEDVDDVFESYGYSSSARYTDDFWSAMPTELQAGRPVVMKGSPDCDFLGIQTCSGHAWVVTGVYDSYSCGTGTYARHYKMNWGWSGAYNGWYISLEPGGNNFNYHQAVVLGIHP